ncbi:cyanophycinase [Sphingobacterium pedocola]|uniref:Cyanophycinase n=1 Tax=Sphingobacterium pedocola TaxID=2082722 RepID=A0ABR9T1M2_9SPHI|nr:cyanophycinase [Sphingobacterium pedocola]MBE8719251.1 cyanophycinase [Sphingobacterium pedocola]
MKTKSTMKGIFYAFAVLAFFASCDRKEIPNPFDPNAPKPTKPEGRTGSIGIVGEVADVQTTTKSGVVIMGGGTDVDAAFRWMIERSGGGDVVVIRSSGTNAYNPYIKGLGNVNSVETLLINSRRLADDDGVAQIIRNAEMLFIAGGDQSDYTGFWKGTKVMAAINYLLTEKKVPVGGTSAGAAVLGNYYFSGERGGVDSEEALVNPYATKVALGRDDFLKTPFLQNVITDQHFSQRNRQGRSVVFLGRIMNDWSKVPQGIAVDERTAVCIDEEGMATVLGANKAFFLKTDATKTPEIFSANTAVTWNHGSAAITVSAISATVSSNKFNMKTFEPENTTGLEKFWWYVVAGSWSSSIRP